MKVQTVLPTLLLAALAAALAAPAPAADAPPPGESPRPAPSFAFVRQASRGERLYQRYCSTCHGAYGAGDGPTAPYLQGPAPQDFTRGVYKFRSTRSGTLPAKDDLVRTILRGVPGTSMPAWEGVLAEPEATDVALFLQTLSPRFETAAPGEPVALPAEATAPDPGSEDRGRAIYLLLGCPACHGERGRGDGPAAIALADARGNPVRPRNFAREPFRGGGEPLDLYRTLATGLDGVPMAPYFADPATLTGPLLAAAGGARPATADPADAGRLDTLLHSVPSSADWEALEPPARQAYVQGWRWDLVHYLRSIRRGLALRALLGIDPTPPARRIR